MTDNRLQRAKQLGRIAEFYFHEAVLEVLADYGRERRYGVRAAEISRKAGLYHRISGCDDYRSEVVRLVMLLLESQGRVENRGRPPQTTGQSQNGWVLTEEELARRQ